MDCFVPRNDDKMTRILVISDTHGNHKILEEVLKINQDCEFLIHLGDEPDDLEYHTELTENMQIFSVYGLYHRKWSEKNAAKRFNINGQDFMIAHAKQYLSIDEKDTIYCYGHTHHKYFYQDEAIVIFNPGHLKNKTDRGESAGYAIIEIGDRKTIYFFDLDHELIEQIEFTDIS